MGNSTSRTRPNAISVRTTIAAAVVVGLAAAGGTAAAAVPAGASATRSAAVASAEPTVEFTGTGVALQRNRAIDRAEADAQAQAEAAGYTANNCARPRPPVVTFEPTDDPRPRRGTASRGIWEAQAFLSCLHPEDLPTPDPTPEPTPDPTPEPPPGTVELVRYRLPGSARYLSSTSAGQPGYVPDRVLGKLLVNPAPGTHALYRCGIWYGVPQTTIHNYAGQCERLGDAYDAQPAGTLPLYSCFVAEGRSWGWMDSTDTTCEGRVPASNPGWMRTFLGYVGQ